MDLNEAFKILEIDLTTDKKTIKAAYSRILKKYHPEEFPDKFIQINEAYKKTLEYAENYSSRYRTENKNDYNNFENIEEKKENYFSKYFYSDNPKREKIFNWIKKLELIIRNKIRPLEKYQKLFKNFNIFEKSEKEEILEILREYNILNKNIKITELEEIFLNYNLDNLEEITNMLEELPENIQTENLNKIKDKLKSNNKKEVKNGYIKFIEDYLNIKFFNLFGINIMLFQKNKKKTGILFRIIKFIKCEIRKDFKFINELSHIFNIESKKVNYFSEISTELSSFLWTGFLLILVSKFLVRSADNSWEFLKISTIFISLFDFINILLEKDFRWSSKSTISNYIFLIINFFFIIMLFTVNEIDEIQLFFQQYIFLNVILFIKMIITSNIRYKRLKNFSKEILDVFVLGK